MQSARARRNRESSLAIAERSAALLPAAAARRTSAITDLSVEANGGDHHPRCGGSGGREELEGVEMSADAADARGPWSPRSPRGTTSTATTSADVRTIVQKGG